VVGRRPALKRVLAADPQLLERMTCKFWLEPLELASNHGFAAKELTTVRNLIRSNFKRIVEAWHDHCDPR
jgi:hypothetical protein